MGMLVDNQNNTRRSAPDDEYDDFISYGSHWDWNGDKVDSPSLAETEGSNDKSASILDDNSSVESIEIIERNKIISAHNSIPWHPNIFDCLDDMLLYSFFRDTSILTERAFNYGKSEQVVVKVKATTLARRKNPRNDEYVEFMNIKKIQKADATFVGEVQNTDKESGSSLTKGTLVTSIQKCPSDAKIMEFPIESLVVLPENLDPGEVAAIVATYLPAFCMLYHGFRNREERFSSHALENKNILLRGGDCTLLEATAKLALLGGANKVSIFNVHSQESKLNRTKNFGGSCNVVLLRGETETTLRRLHSTIDVVIDMEFPLNFKEVRGTLKPTGRFVARKRPSRRGRPTVLDSLCDCLEQAALFTVQGAYLFDFEFMCEADYVQVLGDLKFLFRLLSLRKIRPNIEKYITRKDIPAITEELYKRPVTGDVICESR